TCTQGGIFSPERWRLWRCRIRLGPPRAASRIPSAAGSFAKAMSTSGTPFRKPIMRATIRALWVACVAVVFAVYGHVVQQPRIAQEAYGDFRNVSMDSGLAVIKPLERVWKDDDGES